jgi:type VI secretion system protein ImpI
MPLRLQIVSAHRESMGAGRIKEFAACGGTIGRSLGCDWPLPDAKRYISAKHAMIDYQAGAYYLVDLSRNGIFLNGAKKAVGQGNPQRLFDGDVVRFGDFKITVAIIEDPTETTTDTMTDSVVRAQMVQVDESVELAMLAPNIIDDPVSLDAILTPGDDSGELSALSELPAGAQALLQEAASHGFEEAAQVFLEAAGMDPKDFKGMNPKQLLESSARLLSEYTHAMHALLASKKAITQQLNISVKTSVSNPLAAADGIDNALRLLLSPGSDIHLSGPTAVASACNELIGHQRAVIAAMRNALGDYLGHFDPAALDEMFAAQMQRKGTSGNDFRELYTQAYQGLAKPNSHKLPQRFDEEFARSYELETTE